MKNLFSSALSFVSGRANLVFGYALIAALITLGGFTTALWVKNSNLKVDVSTLNTNLVTTQATVTSLKSVTVTQGETIATLRKLRELDSQVTMGLHNDMVTIKGRDNKKRSEVNELEKRSEKVKQYLDIPLPVELQCVLNPGCPSGPGSSGVGEDRAASTAKVSDRAVRGAN